MVLFLRSDWQCSSTMSIAPNLSTVAPLIQGELALSSSAVGVLLSSFFWVYTPAQLLGGWLVHRFDVRAVLAAGVLLWASAANAAFVFDTA